MTPPADTESPGYDLRDLFKVYNRRTVLAVPELSLAARRVHALLGPNGAGKTTLLNILAFLSIPTTGNLRFFGRKVSFVEKELRVLRREAVMVEQHPILFTTTVYKNLEFGLKIRKIPRSRRVALIGESLELVGMERFMDAPAHRLSGGETQRVALARALVLRPRVLLCDEPTSSVDVENQAIISNILRQINAEQRITVIFTTHDRAQAADLAHQTLLLDHGRLVPARFDNIFSSVITRDENGRAHCAIHPRITLKMASVSAETAALRNPRIFIDPRRIEPRRNPDDHPAVNQFQGRVRRALAANGAVRLVVDCGVSLTITLSRQSYREHRILVGDILHFSIPPAAIEPLNSGA